MTTKSQWLTATKPYFSFMSITDCPIGHYHRAQADEAASTWNITNLIANKQTHSRAYSDS